jgi:hypothetical protein
MLKLQQTSQLSIDFDSYFQKSDFGNNNNTKIINLNHNDEDTNYYELETQYKQEQNNE